MVRFDTICIAYKHYAPAPMTWNLAPGLGLDASTPIFVSRSVESAIGSNDLLFTGAIG